MISTLKLLKACILSPFVLLLVNAVGYAIFINNDLKLDGASHDSLLQNIQFVLGGSIACYLIGLIANFIFGIPTVFILEKLKILNLITLAICGTLLGGVIFYVLTSEFSLLSVACFNDAGTEEITCPPSFTGLAIGGLIGFSVSFAFGLIAGIPAKNK